MNLSGISGRPGVHVSTEKKQNDPQPAFGPEDALRQESPLRRNAGSLPFELNIVLVEPEIPQNTGNVARTCAATGARLHLVGPMGFAIDDRKLKRAGLDYWHLLDITYYESLADFFSRTTGNFFFFSTKAPKTHSEVRYPENCYLFFGKETAGLPEKLLFEHPENCVRIPMRDHPDARSLNLSNSVAVGVYEVLRQWGYPELLRRGELREYSWKKSGEEGILPGAPHNLR